MVPQLDRNRPERLASAAAASPMKLSCMREDLGGRFEHEGPRQKRRLVAGFLSSACRSSAARVEHCKLRRAGLGGAQRFSFASELLRREGQASVSQRLCSPAAIDVNIVRIRRRERPDAIQAALEAGRGQKAGEDKMQSAGNGTSMGVTFGRKGSSPLRWSSEKITPISTRVKTFCFSAVETANCPLITRA